MSCHLSANIDKRAEIREEAQERRLKRDTARTEKRAQAQDSRLTKSRKTMSISCICLKPQITFAV